jgi:hypothetical protein
MTTIESACPTCGVVAERDTYDIGSGPELSCSNCEWCWGAEGQDLKPLPRFTCPRCGMTSYHPADAEHGYCGNCRDWTVNR